MTRDDIKKTLDKILDDHMTIDKIDRILDSADFTTYCITYENEIYVKLSTAHGLETISLSNLPESIKYNHIHLLYKEYASTGTMPLRLKRPKE